MAAHGQRSSPNLILPAGNYSINTSTGDLTGPGISVRGQLASGVLTFKFQQINIQPNAYIAVQGTTPVSFEGQDVVMNGKIISDGNGFPGAAPPRPGTGRGDGAGSGGGKWSQSVGGGGAGYGGKGGNGGSIGGQAPGQGGPAYVDFNKYLQNGSGGGAFGTSPGAGAAGGNGGGAVQISAVEALLINGTISVAGTTGGQSASGGGGGSGGSIVLKGRVVKGAPVLNASGGAGGPGAIGGGGGAGGFIVVVTIQQGVKIPGLNVSGGGGGSAAPGGQGQPGEKGVLFFAPK